MFDAILKIQGAGQVENPKGRASPLSRLASGAVKGSDLGSSPTPQRPIRFTSSPTPPLAYLGELLDSGG